MKIKKNGTIDGYLIADIATVITVVLFVLFIVKKVKFGWFAGGLATTGITLLLQSLLGKAQVRNRSNQMILAKDEETPDIDIVNPDETAIGVDGITILNDNVIVNVTDTNIGESNQSHNVSIELSQQISSISQPFVEVDSNGKTKRSITVYKIPNGVHATVNAKNKVRISSIWGNLIYAVLGGQLTTPPDNGWNKMFGINN